MRDPNLHIPEIEKEKLRENLRVRLPALTDFEIDYVVVVADMYAQEKIDQIFKDYVPVSADGYEERVKKVVGLVDKETI